jgi:signal peptidase I
MHHFRRLLRYQQSPKVFQKVFQSHVRRRFTNTTPRSQNSKLEPSTKKVPDHPEDFGIATHIGRLVCAFGLVYVITEYGVELTICEGPSMLPTIRSRGEIVLLDRFTPRWFGLQGGSSSGKEREKLAQERQQKYEEVVGQKIDGRYTWHETRVPVNKLSREGAWDRCWLRLTTGISVGDVVVVQHPDRVGTVCKRVLGLPGDIVTKPTMRTKKQHILDRSLRDNIIVPDGHLWIEGDNSWNSSDSRSYGTVPAALIVGRVLLRVWPLRGKAMMERGARPVEESDPQFSFSGSVVFPAGYENQVIISDPANKALSSNKE